LDSNSIRKKWDANWCRKIWQICLSFPSFVTIILRKNHFEKTQI
jgi:hypothetical protein